MGQSVSVDAELVALQDLLSLGQGAVAQKPSGPLLEGGLRHHIKAWKYEKRGEKVAETPLNLCDEHGLLSLELQRTASYVILHIRADASASSSEEQSPSGGPAALQELAGRAGAACSPRGLTEAHASRDLCSGLSLSASLQSGAAESSGAGPSDPGLRYSIYVWHGQSVSPVDKAVIFGQADELDCKLRRGILHQRGFLDTRKPVACRNAGQSHSFAGDHVGADANAASDRVRQSGNRLLMALLEDSAVGRATRAVPRPGVVPRFPRLSKALAQAGAAPTANGWTREQRWSQAPSAPLGLSPASGSTLPPVSAAASSTAAPPSHRPGSGATVPRLALGTAAASPLQRDTSRSVETPPIAGRTTDHEEALYDSAGRKRFKGQDAARAPQSARGPTRQGVMPMLNLAALNGQQRQSIASRPDAPAMLNLEEINMSEEDLLNSYDPENEENNYHLPHHIYKQLQLKHFRQVCSEVIPGALFISSFQVASDLESLRKHQITHIVNTAADICDSCFPNEFHYTTYYLKDTNNEDISLLFYRTLEWIQLAISSGGRVLVHCREGVSRSATMVIAYLMWRFSLSFEAAHEMLRKVRPICNPNTGFTFQLLVLGKKLSGASCDGHPASLSAAPDRPLLFRVAPHHPREPFLLLLPVDWSAPWPVIDPRFAWVVQRGPQLVCWIGSQVLDAGAVRETVFKHSHRLEAFERCQCTVKFMVEGEEPPLWQVLGLPSSPGDSGNLVAHRPTFDADFEVLQALAARVFDECGYEDVG